MRAADLFKKVALMALPLAVMTGCNLLTDARTDSDNPSDDAWEQTTDLTSEFGGYDFDGEDPAFGDTEIMKMESEEASVEVVDEDTSIADEPGAFAVRILWGQLEGHRDANTNRLDWSGSISVSSGAVAALRTIAFEFPNDHLLRRDNRQELGFVLEQVHGKAATSEKGGLIGRAFFAHRFTIEHNQPDRVRVVGLREHAAELENQRGTRCAVRIHPGVFRERVRSGDAAAAHPSADRRWRDAGRRHLEGAAWRLGTTQRRDRFSRVDPAAARRASGSVGRPARIRR